MRVVLDTNVIISATLIRGGNEDQILRAWQRGAFDLVLSPPILEEIGRALFYEKLRKFRWMTEGQISDLLHALALGSASLASGAWILGTGGRNPHLALLTRYRRELCCGPVPLRCTSDGRLDETAHAGDG
jgi:hypothetical protein